MREAWKVTALWVLATVPGLWQAMAVYQSALGARLLLHEIGWQVPVWGVAVRISEVMFGALSECSACPPHPQPPLQGPTSALWPGFPVAAPGGNQELGPSSLGAHRHQLPILGSRVGLGGRGGAEGVQE